MEHKIDNTKKPQHDAKLPIMPSFIQCTNCKYYNGVHNLLPKVKCEWKPTSDELRHRAIEGDIVDCPMPYYGLNWA